MKPQPVWILYMLRCADNTLYTGITVNLERRLAEHQAQGKQCAKYLRGKGPLVLVFTTTVGTKAEATRLEGQLKRQPKAKKEQLVAGQITLDELGLSHRPAASGHIL